jgi:regulator of CtrA degradation
MSTSVSGVFEIGGAVSFGRKLAESEAFKSLFREGMYLVELSAAYLDGPGRLESKALPRAIALAYASESMRLTTRLMQLASWLLMQRAVNEGDLTPAQATLEKNKVKLSRQDLSCEPPTFALLPDVLQDLCQQSLRLQARILHLDGLLYQGPAHESARARPIAIESQLTMLREAFQISRG